MISRFHEVAMLAAQMWGEANAEGADPGQFGADAAIAYAGAFSCMDAELGTGEDYPADLRDIAGMRVV